MSGQIEDDENNRNYSDRNVEGFMAMQLNEFNRNGVDPLFKDHVTPRCLNGIDLNRRFVHTTRKDLTEEILTSCGLDSVGFFF